MVKRWKNAFFTVLIVFLAFILLLVGLYNYYFPSVDESEFLPDQRDMEGEEIFTVATTKNQLTHLINDQLATYELKNLNLNVEMDDELALTGAIAFFGRNVAFEMDFDPVVQNDGDLVLVEKSVKLGKLALPEDRVLAFIKKGTSLPDWVEILPKEEKIYIALNDITFADQFSFRAETIDLEEDDIRFKVDKQ